MICVANIRQASKGSLDGIAQYTPRRIFRGSDMQKSKMRKLSRIVVVTGALTSSFFLYGAYSYIGVAMASGLGVSALSMSLAYVRNTFVMEAEK